MKKKYYLQFIIMATILLISCDQRPTLQSYYVEKMEDSSFLIVNLPFELKDLFKNDLTPEETKVIANVEKLNLLIFRLKKGEELKYQRELSQIKSILENKKYHALMDFKAFNKGQGRLMFEGETDRIKEGIVFLNSTKMGFGVLRILGSDINPTALMKLAKKINPNQLKEQLNSSSLNLGGLFEDVN